MGPDDLNNRKLMINGEIITKNNMIPSNVIIAKIIPKGINMFITENTHNNPAFRKENN